MKHAAFAILAIGLAGCAGAPKPSFAPPTPLGNLPGSSALTSVPSLQPPAASLPTPETLTVAQIAQRLDPFANPACALPCYNGLAPAQADFSAALIFYSRLGISPADMVPGDYQNALDGTGHLSAALLRASDIEEAAAAGHRPPRVDVALQSGVVDNILVNWPEYPAFLSIPTLFQQLGAPDELKLGLMFSAKPPTFLIQLTYFSRQSGFVFSGATEGGEQSLAICPDTARVTGSALGVYPPGVPPLSNMDFAPLMLPMAESAGVTAEQFLGLAQSGSCLYVSADRWAQWQTVAP